MHSTTPLPSALPPRGAAPQLAKGEHLTFRLGAEEYGIDILRVQEIRGYEAPTRIANTPPFFRGVLNLRGVIVPIIDLRLKFGLDNVTCDGVTVTVILNVAGRTVGAVVDAVCDVIELDDEQVRPTPEFGSMVDAGYILGIGVLRQDDLERTLILIDIERLMAHPDMGLAVPLAH